MENTYTNRRYLDYFRISSPLFGHCALERHKIWSPVWYFLLTSYRLCQLSVDIWVL